MCDNDVACKKQRMKSTRIHAGAIARKRLGLIITLVSGEKFKNHVGIIDSRLYILGGNMFSSVDQTSLDFLKPRRKKDDISTCTLEMILSK